MSKAQQTWYTVPGGTVYEISVRVNGELLSARAAVSDVAQFGQAMPVRYIQQDLRRQLLREIADRLGLAG